MRNVGASLLLLGCCACADGDSPAKIERLEAENASLRQSVAGPNAYQCRVTLVKELDDKGALVEAAAKFREQVIGTTFVFVLPGSRGACRDAWEGILRAQLDARHKPCNFVELMPRLNER